VLHIGCAGIDQLAIDFVDLSVFPVGGRLIVVEAAGEVVRFSARRSAIVAAIQETRPR
jgi:hypothetical protein